MRSRFSSGFLLMLFFQTSGDLTEKGYTKKLKMLIAPHLQKSEHIMNQNNFVKF